MTSEATHEDLIDALGRPGCAVCRLVARRGDSFLETYCYEHVNDVELRAVIRGARGFCRRHGQDFLAKLDALAVAITYRDILNTLVTELDGLAVDDRPAVGRIVGWLRRSGPKHALRAPDPCPVCQAEQAAERRVLEVLAQGLTELRLTRALASGDPLCLAHLQGALVDGAPTRELLARQRTGWSRLRDHLMEIIRKSDHHRRMDELTSAERESIRSAVQAVAGYAHRPADDVQAQLRRLRRGGSRALRSAHHAPPGEPDSD
jgi:hypothetical protein